jgi:membrane-associated PAP2 superfamily phosphatase
LAARGQVVLIAINVLIGTAGAVTAVSLAGFDIDLAIAALLYDPAGRRFLATDNPYAAMLRDHGRVALFTCIGCIALALARYLPWRLPSLPGRAVIFLTASLLIGPGLLVNGILKEHWGRPRPVAVVQFGGSMGHMSWWKPSGACEHNCSFVSGESATAAWLFGPAMLVPPLWRGVAIAATAVFNSAIGILRMAVGAHFFTDVLFGALSTLFILLLMQRVFLVSTNPRKDARLPMRSSPRPVGKMTEV